MKKDIQIVEERLNKAVIKNLDDLLNDELFKQTSKLLEEEKYQLLVKLETLNKIAPEFSTYLSNSTTLLLNLAGYYAGSNSTTKQQLVSSIFPEKLYFEKNHYRTTKINEVVELIFNVGKGFNENCFTNNVKQSGWAPPSRLERETL